MAQPNNPKLYNTLLNQARAKYPAHGTLGLGFAAAKWLSNEYAKQGGGYVDSIKQVDPKLRDYKQEAVAKKKSHEKYVKDKMKKRGFVV